MNEIQWEIIFFWLEIKMSEFYQHSTFSSFFLCCYHNVIDRQIILLLNKSFNFDFKQDEQFETPFNVVHFQPENIYELKKMSVSIAHCNLL